MAEWVNGKVTGVQHWTDGLFSITVNAPIDSFTAGQFAKLSLEIGGERVQRAYSYVNAPSDPNLEFYLVTVPEGKLSPSLHQLQPGAEVMVTKEAAGFFVLEEVPDCDTLWMLATGTAIGPYLSILQEGKDLDRFNNLVLVHAARFARDLSYLPLMQQLQQRFNGKLRIQTVVSREEVAGSLTGRVPALLEDGRLEAAVGLTLDAETSHVMLCGNPQMVRDTQQTLKRNIRCANICAASRAISPASITGSSAEFYRFGLWPESVIPWVPEKPQIDRHHHHNQRRNKTPHAPLPDRRQHLPVTSRQYPRQDQQQRPPALFITIVQALDQHRRRWPQQRHDTKGDGLDRHHIVVGQRESHRHQHHPDCHPDPEVAPPDAALKGKTPLL